METDRFFDAGFVVPKETNDADLFGDPDLRENRNLAKKYEELMRQEGNQLDMKNKYRRSLVQTVNLGLAVLFLFVLVFKQ
jgi:hypothetical protein